MEATIRAVNDELRKLPSVVSVDEDDDTDNSGKKITAAGRSFFKELASVETAKSPVDWVDMKGGKPTKGAAEDDSAPASVAERRRRRRAGQ